MKETKKNGAAQSKAGKRDYSAFKNMYRKIPQDLRDVIVYYIGDRPLVIHEGVNEVTGEVVTAEFIRQWHMVARFMSTSTSINAEKPRSAASQQYPGGRHRKKHRLMICRPTSGRL